MKFSNKPDSAVPSRRGQPAPHRNAARRPLPSSETGRKKARAKGQTGSGARLLLDFGKAAVLMAVAAKIFYPAPDKTGPQKACELSGVNAAAVASEKIMRPAGGFTGDYLQAENIFRAAAGNLALNIPPYINATYMSRLARFESNNGADTYTRGNPHFGLFGYGSDASNSPLDDHMAFILRVVDSVKGDIPVLHGCEKITAELIKDANFFKDPILGAVIGQALALVADQALARHENYAKLTDSQRQAALYLYHNLPAAAVFALHHWDSSRPLLVDLADDLRQAKHAKNYRKAYRLAEMKRLMANNEIVYPFDKRPYMTARQLLGHIDAFTAQAAQSVATYDPSLEFDERRNADAIRDFLIRSPPDRSQTTTAPRSYPGKLTLHR